MNAEGMKEYLFTYEFQGAKWDCTLFARSPVEAIAKVKAMSEAQFTGEMMTSIPVPTWYGRIVEWWRS